jgi:hypothetical protein
MRQDLPGHRTNFIIHYWAFIIRYSLEQNSLFQAMSNICAEGASASG